ncbi:acyl-CoA dehydrogenase family protein [Kineosporia rhizophila]|uniref:acyl-CoA dehydrogenase family protein n=1 Tax=Kineosporia TaxID=49184 RepID=UPI001E604EC6|nr:MULTISPECIES: acyl-CoA dehydrogenase family protein [Kineosporia]MCE0534779.1 acyl-CoA dehydrogenase family protein [Kineosporia rhizophila]GLY19294.1 hypothetical protein Kisp01_63080 [Kineosporia sp. NBRC 101677]
MNTPEVDPLAATEWLRGRLRDTGGSRPDLLAASGLLGITVPAAFGGPACSVVTLTEVLAGLAAADRDLATLLHGHYLFLRALTEQGVRDQQEYFFAEARAGACFGGTGPGFGPPASGATVPAITLARWRNGVYRLDGESFCGPGVLRAGWLVVRAVLVDELAESTPEPDEVFAVIRHDELGVTHDGPGADGGLVWLDGVRVAAGCVVPYSTLFDRPTTYEARRLVTAAALDGLPPEELRPPALAVDQAEAGLDTVENALGRVTAASRVPLAERYAGM